MITTFEAMKPFGDLAAESPTRLAPERASDLVDRMRRVGADTIEIVNGSARFVAMTGDDQHIRVSTAALASLWSLSHVALSFIEVAAKAAASPEGQSADTLTVFADPTFKEMIDFARRLFDHDEPWPENIKVPRPDDVSNSLGDRVKNLFLAATGWVILHEVGHLTLGHRSDLAGNDGRKQEEEADAFAFDWVLEQCPADAREFRVLAITVAVGWIFLHEQSRRGPGGYHPKAIIRLWQAQSKFGVADDSPALEAASYFFKAVFDPESDDMPTGMSAVEAFDWMVDRLEFLFPRD